MLYQTLIVFDTNKLRDSVNGGDLRYADFLLGGDYNVLAAFTKENKLEDYINFAIPEIVIQELLKQKIDQYNADISRFSATIKSLQEIGAVKEVSFSGVDIEKILENKKAEFLRKNPQIEILKIGKDDHSMVFEDILMRSIQKQPPFKKGTTDAGFKDVVIWETILKNLSSASRYDQIFFLTNDSGFDDCEREFIQKNNRNFQIIKDWSILQTRLEDLYADIIENLEIFSFVQSSYYDDQVKDYIRHGVGRWEKDQEEFDITSVQILDKCAKFEKIEGDKDLGVPDMFSIETYVGLDLERDDDERGEIYATSDAYVTASINEENEIVDFEIE